MATPTDCAAGALQQVATGSSADVDVDGMADIPRRLMRVKVLYTFDDQNKSNCLARLPNALSIPTVSLDDTTQVGVIDLKTCIQAIVTASPELVAKLGHDYTVYAFDFSEYETPLVGQGMLSWILASASTTPNAPAHQSQTMVTGRVCKNILGLFSKGIQETLEVKLKLVPVPTCLQSEYVENMERYHNLSKLLPEGLQDYNAWAQFLEANPAIRQLAQPTPINPVTSIESNHASGLDSMHQMLSRQNSADNLFRFDSFQDQQLSFDTYDTRASSPAMSTASLGPITFPYDTRPDSRVSFHSDSAAFAPQYFSHADPTQEQQEEGPPKKRARITQAKRPKKTALVNNDSLRVTASTAASVRLHKPAAGHAGAAVSIEQVPRAPTPRPGNPVNSHYRGSFRPVAPSTLRHASVESTTPYVSPYEPSILSDAAVESADDERGDSPAETPLHMPSSPPVMNLRTASSSPDLPSLPPPNDSGFVSDMPSSREEEDPRVGSRRWTEQDTSANPTATSGTMQVDPSRVQKQPRPPVNDAIAYSAPPPASAELSVEEVLLRSFQGPGDGNQMVKDGEGRYQDHSMQGFLPPAQIPTPSAIPNMALPDQQIQSHAASAATSPDAHHLTTDTANTGVSTKPSNTADSKVATQVPRPPKARVLERSQTWSGELMSDAAGPGDSKGRQPRSGSGAKRRFVIKDQLEKALVQGKMPQYCNHCGQIDTPAWRKAYTRIEKGIPDGIKLSSKGHNICAVEFMPPEEGEDGSPRYRIFKQSLSEQDAESETFTTLILCNPCGLWLGKRNSMRPQSVWMKAQEQAVALANGEKPKRKPRKPRKPKGERTDTMSDAAIPESEIGQPETRQEAKLLCNLDGAADESTKEATNPPPSETQGVGSKATEEAQLDKDAAQAALLRAIQSSPAGLRGTKDSPINVEEDLTPKPTRRILFPSPRRPGEVKLLGEVRSVPSMSEPSTSRNGHESNAQLSGTDVEETDKENCPPSMDDFDGLSHLFDNNTPTKTTPTKGRSLDDVLKTPTPASRRRVPLTPKRNSDTFGLITPSRVLKTPRTAKRTATVAPETPFTRQLNALLSDCIVSPSQMIDFSALPTFNTPGRVVNTAAGFGDLLSNDFLSSDLPIPSSPPGGLNFSVFEDPHTSTVGLWSGASIFESNEAVNEPMSEGERRASADATFRITDINMDFSALLEGVIPNTEQAHAARADQALDGQSKNAEEREAGHSIEGLSETLAKPSDSSRFLPNECTAISAAVTTSSTGTPATPATGISDALVQSAAEGVSPNKFEKLAIPEGNATATRDKESKSPNAVRESADAPANKTNTSAPTPEARTQVDLVGYVDTP